jgi:hypothetical protein
LLCGLKRSAGLWQREGKSLRNEYKKETEERLVKRKRETAKKGILLYRYRS